MSVRFVVPARIAFLAAAAILLLACSREPANPTDAELVVARVNGTPITLMELKEEMAARQGISRSADPQTTGREVSAALRRLLERAVVLAEGRRLGVAVSEADVEAEVRRYRSDFPPGGLEKILLQQGIGMSEWRARMRRSLLYRKATEAITAGRTAVSEDEVREEYRKRASRSGHPDQIRVRQLFFDSRESAVLARARILAGSRPEEVVPQGGEKESVPAVVDLGYLSRDDLPAGIAENLFRLPPGGVSGVVRRNRSYSLFLVEGTRKADAGSVEDAAPGIRAELLGEKRNETFRKWVEEHMAKADIQVRKEILDQITGGTR